MSLAISKASRKAILASPKSKAATAVACGAIAGVVTGIPAAPYLLAAPTVHEHKRPAPDGFGPMQARPFSEASAVANAAAGLKAYTVTAPDREEDAVSYNLHGRRSVEHAPAHVVPSGGERRFFDPETIGQETRQINKQAETLAALSHSGNDKAREKKERVARQPERDPHQAQYEMGDYLDDENGWDEAIDFGKGKRR